MTHHTVHDVAEHFTVAPATVRGWAADLGCPHGRDRGGRLVFDLDVVREWYDTSGIARRSEAQTARRRRQDDPPIHILDFAKWTAEQVQHHDAKDKPVVALARTLRTAVFILKAAGGNHNLPVPHGLSEAAPKAREHLVGWLAQVPRLPRATWHSILDDATVDGLDTLLKAIHEPVAA